MNTETLIADIYRAALLGGASMDLNGENLLFQKGYSVGLLKHGSRLTGFNSRQTKDVLLFISEWVKRVTPVIEKTNNFIGVWYDGEKDILCLDVSTHIDDAYKAHQRAASEGQECIWSFADNIEVYIDYTDKELLHRYITDVLLPYCNDVEMLGQLSRIMAATINTMLTRGLSGPVGARKALYSTITDAFIEAHGQ